MSDIVWEAVMEKLQEERGLDFNSIRCNNKIKKKTKETLLAGN